MITIIKGIALTSGLLLGGAPFLSGTMAPQETVVTTAEDREAAAEAAVQTIEDKVGHDLVNIEFNDGTVVLRPVESFDEINDQDAFAEITAALQALGYEKIAAVGKPVYVEEAPEFDLDSLTAEKDIDIEAVALPEVDPEFSHVIRA